MIRFNKKYFIWAITLFIIEVLIALFVKDRFVRPYVGDYLVVILMYTFIRAFVKAPVIITAVIVLLFAYLVEVLQYFDIVDKLGLEGNKIARTVIGYGFEWMDLLAYTLGIVTVLFIERGNIRG